MIDPTRYKALDALQIWSDNYNSGDVALIARSIRRFGFNNALRVWLHDTVMAGNHSTLAVRQIHDEGPKEGDHDFPPKNILVEDGVWYVPFISVEHLDQTEALAFAIADNEIARQSVRDEHKLTEYLHDIAERDREMMHATGFTDVALERLMRQHMEHDQSDDAGDQSGKLEELQAKWQTERGQLWLIPSKTADGVHRLLCGDSTSLDEVQRLMDGKRAALFATDPPYLVDYDGTNHPHKWGEPDKNKDWGETYTDWDDSAQGEALYVGFVKAAVEVAILPDAAWYCWHASRNQAMLERVWTDAGAFVHQQIIWAKDRPILTRSWYMWSHEPAFFGWLKGNKPKRMAEDYPPTVWRFATIAPGTETLHPTSKPVELFAIPMQQHTAPGDICFEPFSGSGSQLVAGEQQGRLVYGLELQPAYVAAILERAALLGLEPRLSEE